MTVTQITQTRFEVELDGDDLRILNYLTTKHGWTPQETIKDILNETLQLAKRKFIAALR